MAQCPRLKLPSPPAQVMFVFISIHKWFTPFPQMKLHVKVTPNARKSEVVGWEEDPTHGRVLRIRIAAPPVDGKANTALRAFLADWLGLPKSQVSLEKGDTSRLKTFLIPDGCNLDHALSPGRFASGAPTSRKMASNPRSR